MNETTPAPNKQAPTRSGPVLLPTNIPTSVRGYMYEEELYWLFHAAWITKLQGVKGELLEIGSFEGLSACALAQAGHLTCVDNWDYVLGTVDSRHSFDAFTENMRMMRLDKKVKPILGDSRQKLPELAATGVKFRLIFVDGAHDFETAASDIKWSWEMLSPGGLLVIDDYCGWPDVMRACEVVDVKTLVGATGKMAVKAKEFK